MQPVIMSFALNHSFLHVECRSHVRTSSDGGSFAARQPASSLAWLREANLPTPARNVFLRATIPRHETQTDGSLTSLVYRPVNLLSSFDIGPYNDRAASPTCTELTTSSYAVVTTSTRLRFDGHSTASLKSQWRNLPAAVTLTCLLGALLRPKCSSPQQS